MDMNFDLSSTSHWMLIMAAAILVILSLLEKRKVLQNLCFGRPSLVIPYRFLDGFENRTAYAMAFGTTTSTVVSLITSRPSVLLASPLAVKALDVYLQAMVGCLTCFPLFACLTTRYRAVGAILCLVYSVIWLAFSIIQVLQDLQKNANSTLLGVHIGTGDTTALQVTYAYDILQGLPIIFCYVVLIGHSFYTLKECYTSKTYFRKGLECTIRPHQEEHVRWVLRKFQLKESSQPEFNVQESFENTSSQRFVDQMKASIKLRYFTSFKFFKYPTRVMALAFVQVNVLYWIGLLMMMGTITVLYLMINAEFAQQIIDHYVLDLLIMISVCSSFSLVVCIGNAILQIVISFRNYRFDILRIYQGDKTFVPVLKETSQYILTRSMSYPGFQVAFMMWGVVVCFAVVLLLTLIPALVIYILALSNILDDVAIQVIQLLSFPATVLALFYLQALLAKAILMQNQIKATDKCPPLNVDNRKLFELLNYYSLFTNLAVGVFTCLWRIAQSAMFGIFYVGRLDRSVFTREIETYDKGYAAYTSMLLVDNAHNNPCMRVFAHLLWTKTLAARLKQHQSEEEQSEHTTLITDNSLSYRSNETSDYISDSSCSVDTEESHWTFCEINETCVSGKASLRWHLAYTLINNPQLCKLRKNRLRQDSSKRQSLIGDFEKRLFNIIITVPKS